MYMMVEKSAPENGTWKRKVEEMLFSKSGAKKLSLTLSTTAAREHLRCLSFITVDPAKRVAAARQLFEIGQLLGPQRVLNELIPFLSDVIEGPATYPLMPPTFIDDASGLLLTMGTEPKSEAAVLGASLGESATAAVNAEPPIMRDIPVTEGRPPLAAIGTNPGTRIMLFRAVLGASENDFVFEELAQQLGLFVPTLVSLQNSVLVIG
eukprot:Blabericola_migrator_1__13289@NODE_92_length_14506_cov_884_657940_g82_i0_p7_GENE_NODE_92_length_14506_cov_884_657940_g82_i0NODE_92_length_14506_cov_884_657940_g82_i0_p7_ORF_typecomplete_len208_score24_80_NODE_92_length_14506_cov_884_657940_g82_i091889811